MKVSPKQEYLETMEAGRYNCRNIVQQLRSSNSGNQEVFQCDVKEAILYSSASSTLAARARLAGAGPEAGAGSAEVVEASGASFVAASGADSDFLLLFFFFLFCDMLASVLTIYSGKGAGGGLSKTYLLPSPQRLETIKEAHILKQVREQPQARRHSKDGNTEQNQAENRHRKEQSKQTHHAHTQIPHSLAQHYRPQGEEHHGENTGHDGCGHGLLLPLRTLPQPHVVHHWVCLLVLLDFDGPLALDAVLGLRVVVAFMGVDFAYAQGEKREWEELEDVLGGGAVCDGWEEGVLLCGGFGVGWGFDCSDCSLD